MFLAVDVGNTSTVFAVFDGDKIIAPIQRIPTGSLVSDIDTLDLHETIDSCVVCSVVPSANAVIKNYVQTALGANVYVMQEDISTYPITVDMRQPEEVGADRIANAVAAHALYGGPSIVIDFGTATTVDVITKDARYIGGAIAPGIELSLQTLHQATAKLPKISLKQPEKVIGKNTVQAMQSGMFWGYAGMIERLITEVNKELAVPKSTVVGTGGLAQYYGEDKGLFDYIEPNLTLNGIQQLFAAHVNQTYSKASKS